jgi:hypothetical protein
MKMFLIKNQSYSKSQHRLGWNMFSLINGSNCINCPRKLYNNIINVEKNKHI